MESASQFALELKNITKSYPGVLALDNINLQVRRGSVHGFIGPNGAGKSTTMKIIAGLIPPNSGEVYINGIDALKRKSDAASSIGILPETPPLYTNMKVRDYLRFCQDINNHSMPGREEVLDEKIERCGLTSVQNRLIGPLSKGFKQRVAIAQTLVYGAEIIVLDEPTVGLDPNAIAEMRDLILELKKDHTILLSTHQLYEVGRVCDEVTIINNGRILKTGNLTEVQSEFSAYKTFEALVPKVGEALKANLLAKEYVQGCDISERAGEYLIKIRVSGGEDHRSQLTSLIVEHGNLFQFTERTMELEDIFKEVVR